MILHVKNTARPAVRSMAEVKKLWGNFSVSKVKVWDWSTNFIFGVKS